ncbi:hypothetical protein D3C79_1011650 [compost metagenome]
MIHIIAKQIAAARQLYERHRFDAFCADIRAGRIAHLHAASHFAVSDRILKRIIMNRL